MLDLGGWSAVAGGLLAVAAAAAHTASLVRAYIGHRTRLAVERERSARARARAAGLRRLAGDGQVMVRVRERDCDGQRTIELGRRSGDREAA